MTHKIVFEELLPATTAFDLSDTALRHDTISKHIIGVSAEILISLSDPIVDPPNALGDVTQAPSMVSGSDAALAWHTRAIPFLESRNVVRAAETVRAVAW